MNLTVTLYHNPNCSKSRETLAILRNHSIEPIIVDYLTTPCTREQLHALHLRLAVPLTEMMRINDARYAELNLSEPDCSETKRFEALLNNPELLNRPIAVSELGARVCRPPEIVLEIVPEYKQ